MNKYKFICTSCGIIGKPKKITKGYFIIEIILWLFFFVPGLIYTIWRLSTKYDACPKCRHQSMIPLDSPRGQKLIPLMRRESMILNQKNSISQGTRQADRRLS